MDQTILDLLQCCDGKLVDLRMLTSHTTHPETWCIQKVNKCYYPNAQMQPFIYNLEATTSQVHAMAQAVAAAVGGRAPVALLHSHMKSTCPTSGNTPSSLIPREPLLLLTTNGYRQSKRPSPTPIQMPVVMGTPGDPMDV